MSMLKPQVTSHSDQEIDLGAWEVTEELVEEYTRAVGDTLPLYSECRLTPPVAIAAWTLGRLLNHLNLPAGAIHSLQEINTLRAVRFGEKVRARVQMSKPRRRGGTEFITAAFSIHTEGSGAGDPGFQNAAITGKTTVLVTEAASGDRDEETPAREVSQRPLNRDELGEIPQLERVISQSRLQAYAKASGDFNPLHLDPEFAASTRFGGIIAHGMLTLALISENMAGAFGMDWLNTGALKVRFKGAAYLGDRIGARCRITKETVQDWGQQTECSVQVVDQATGRELVSGDASVSVKSHELQNETGVITAKQSGVSG